MTIVYLILAAAAVFLIVVFNRLVRLRQRANGAWSDIDVQLKRRWDLIPTLVATVEGYTTHEKDTLNRVVEARADALKTAEGGTKRVTDLGERELAVGTALFNVLALVEAYPDLKADRSFRQLHTQLVEIENALQHARRYYNAVVRDFNTLIESFPSNIVASLFRFDERQFFQIDAAERATPIVDLPG